MAHHKERIAGGLFVLAAMTGPDSALANDRAAYLVDQFERLCTQQPLSFEGIDATSKNMHFPVQQDDTTTFFGAPAHEKVWTINGASGPFKLMALDAPRPFIRVEACVIDAPDAQGDDIANILVSKLNLGAPAVESTTSESPKRHKIITWGKQINHKWTELYLMYPYPLFPGFQLQARVTHATCAPGIKEGVFGTTQMVSFGGAVSVIDAKTLDVCGIRVTLLEIGAPDETDPIGADAKKALTEIVGNDGVSCTDNVRSSPEAVEGLCRLGAGGDVGDLLVRAGYAVACGPLYKGAEQDARERHVGMWQRQSPTVRCP